MCKVGAFVCETKPVFISRTSYHAAGPDASKVVPNDSAGFGRKTQKGRRSHRERRPSTADAMVLCVQRKMSSMTSSAEEDDTMEMFWQRITSWIPFRSTRLEMPQS